MEGGGGLLGQGDSLSQHLTPRHAEQPGELAGVRRENHRSRGAGHQLRLAFERVDPVRVQDHGKPESCQQVAHEAAGRWVGGEAGTQGDGGLPLCHGEQGLQGLPGKGPRCCLGEWCGHHLGELDLEDIVQTLRHGERHEPRPRPLGGRGAQGRCTCLAHGASDHQDVPEGPLVGRGIPRGKGRGHVARLQEPHGQCGVPGELRRDADVDDPDRPRVSRCRVQDEAPLGQGKGDGEGRADRRSFRLRGIRNQPRGDVHGHDGTPRAIHALDGLGEQSLCRSTSPRPQECIHHDVGCCQAIPERSEARGCRDFRRGGTQPLQDLQVDASVALHLVPAGQEERLHLDPAAPQVPCHHKPVTAVVPSPAEDHHPGAGQGGEGHAHLACRLGSRVLHQQEGRDAVLGGGASIQLLHLLGAYHVEHGPREQGWRVEDGGVAPTDRTRCRTATMAGLSPSPAPRRWRNRHRGTG